MEHKIRECIVYLQSIVNSIQSHAPKIREHPHNKLLQTNKQKYQIKAEGVSERKEAHFLSGPRSTLPTLFRRNFSYSFHFVCVCFLDTSIVLGSF